LLICILFFKREVPYNVLVILTIVIIFIVTILGVVLGLIPVYISSDKGNFELKRKFL